MVSLNLKMSDLVSGKKYIFVDNYQIRHTEFNRKLVDYDKI